MEQTTIKQLKKDYEAKKSGITARLKEFKSLPESEHEKELFFCLLTPQSDAKRCWDAVEQMTKEGSFDEEKIREILRTRTRFHNNKTLYVIEAEKAWNNIRNELKRKDIKELRNWLADNIKGYGLKEASHFLRNIGKSNNELAILDRHILRNLVKFRVIRNDRIKSRKDYLEKEEKYLQFAKSVDISADELDMLWWSTESGELFK